MPAEGGQVAEGGQGGGHQPGRHRREEYRQGHGGEEPQHGPPRGSRGCYLA